MMVDGVVKFVGPPLAELKTALEQASDAIYPNHSSSSPMEQ